MTGRAGLPDAGMDLRAAAGTERFACVLAGPPWRLINRTGKMAPEHKRLSRHGTMDAAAVRALPVSEIAAPTAHLHLWVPNALSPEGLQAMKAWASATGPISSGKDREGRRRRRPRCGLPLPNVTDLVLFGVRGKDARAGAAQVNHLATRKREHSCKPGEIFDAIEACSPGPRIELFARGVRLGWIFWGSQAIEEYEPTWKTHRHNSAAERRLLVDAD